MSRTPVVLALALATALAFRAAPAAIADQGPFMPLEVGWHWEYAGLAGSHQTEIITGTRTLLGRTVFVKSYGEGADAGLENFWLNGPNGEVLLAGFDTATHDLAFAYDPPITLCGGAPSLGDIWTSHVTIYKLADLSVYDTIDIAHSALELPTLSVPAGTFDCVGVGQVLVGPSPARVRLAGRVFTMDGRQVVARQDALSTNATDWFARGVGVVQYATADTYQLVGYGMPTAALRGSWGALKVLYR